MSAFNFKKNESETNNATQREVRRPIEKNYTESETINLALTKGLYHNSYPGLKLAGALAFAPIAVPVWFMGIPVVIPQEENKETKDLIIALVEEYYLKCNQINLQCHRDGTIWVYPHYSAKNNSVVWDFIPDDSVTDIIKDFETGDPVKIITDENVTITTGYNKTATVRRRREFTEKKVRVEYIQVSGIIEKTLFDKTMRNVSGILPVNFSNNADGSEMRGHSDYERIVPDLKSYHDVEYSSQVHLAKFNVKMIQNVKSYEQWKDNLLDVNGWDSVDEIDLAKMDMVINQEEESTTFEWPQGAYQAAEAKLKTLYRKVVEGSGIPEIAWGLKTEGNHASVEESMGSLGMYVEDKRTQKTEKYRLLFQATIDLWAIANIKAVGKISVIWNDLESVSPETKSKIFMNYARGISTIIDKAGWTEQQLYKLYQMVMPEITEETYEEFVKGIKKMASHVQFTNASHQEGLDFDDDDSQDE